jgi:hypothetical protein
MTVTLPSGGSSAIVTPPILGEYTSMLFQVQQNSDVLSRSPHLQFNGIGGHDDTTDQT